MGRSDGFLRVWTRAWLADRPAARFEFTFTPKPPPYPGKATDPARPAIKLILDNHCARI
jgi:hypothetical protein